MNFSRKIREEASPGRTQRILEKGQMSYRSFVSEIREPCIQQKSNTDPRRSHPMHGSPVGMSGAAQNPGN